MKNHWVIECKDEIDKTILFGIDANIYSLSKHSAFENLGAKIRVTNEEALTIEKKLPTIKKINLKKENESWTIRNTSVSRINIEINDGFIYLSIKGIFKKSSI
jgi:hypothetical protein